jgi:hypothetical protein
LPKKLCAPRSARFPSETGKSPLLANNLTRAPNRANSRFLTDCYLQNAAKLPKTRQAADRVCLKSRQTPRDKQRATLHSDFAKKTKNNNISDS